MNAILDAIHTLQTLAALAVTLLEVAVIGGLGILVVVALRRAPWRMALKVGLAALFVIPLFATIVATTSRSSPIRPARTVSSDDGRIVHAVSAIDDPARGDSIRRGTHEAILLVGNRTRNAKDEGSSWFGDGYSLHHEGRYDEAIAAFKKSIDHGYRKATSMYNIACGYALKGDTASALQWLGQALDAGFSSEELLFRDSDLESIRSDPRFRSLVASYAPRAEERAMRERQEDIRDAMDELRELRNDGSVDGHDWYSVGTELLTLRELDEGIAALQKAAEYLEWRNSSALYNLACAHALGGNSQAALDLLDRSLDAGFDDPTKIRTDPDLRSLRGNPRYAELIAKAEALTLSSGLREDKDNLRSERRWASAIARYDAYLRDHPNSGRAWFALGFATHYSGQYDRALSAFDRALQLDYRKPVTMYNIACAHAQAGHIDLAFQWLQRADAAGFEMAGRIHHDDDLDPLRDDPRFEQFERKADETHWREKMQREIKRQKKHLERQLRRDIQREKRRTAQDT